MVFRSENNDLFIAQRICNELRAGNTEVLSELYHKYHVFFSVFARQRLFISSECAIDNVLSDFWIELLNAKAICNYEGKASLRTYLTLILSRRIIDANRNIKREIISEIAIEYEGTLIPDDDLQQSPDKDLLKKELQRILHEALLQLSDKSPKDANLIRMHLEGMTYEEMAKKELHEEKINQKKLKKKTDAIKKQFTRDNTGSMAKFKKILNKCLKNNALDFRDLLN